MLCQSHVKAVSKPSRSRIKAALKPCQSGAKAVPKPFSTNVEAVALPKPFRSLGVNWHPAARAVVTDGGLEVWNGTGLVGQPAGVVSAVDSGEAVELTVGSGGYALEARLP